MTATDEPRIQSTPAQTRRARRQVEEVSFDELIAGFDESATDAPAPAAVQTGTAAAMPAPAAKAPAAQPSPDAEQPAPKAARTHANAIAATPAAAPAPVRPRASADEHPKGRFYRPELYSTTQRITGSVVVKVTAVVLLLSGTGTLVYLALDRFN